MKKVGCTLVIIVLFSIITARADERVRVVSTITVLETLAEEVGGEKIDVVSLVQPGICPTYFDIKPSDISDVGNASLILYSGIEPWLDDLITSSGNGDVKKALLDGDWSTPESVILLIEGIKNALCDVDPVNTEYYENNAERKIEELREIAESIREDAESLKVKNVDVICMQWQKKFVEWVGFNIIASYGPQENVSMKDINDLVKKKAVLVIDNLQSGTELGSQIASEIGAQHVVLTNFPGAVPGTETFSDMMEYNVSQLFNAMKAYNDGEKPEESSHMLGVGLIMLAVVCVVVVLYFKKK